MATLYRHLKQLHDGGLLEIVGERQVRGGVERTYRVVTEAVSLGTDDLLGADADDHFRYFATFVGTMLPGPERRRRLFNSIVMPDDRSNQHKR